MMSVTAVVGLVLSMNPLTGRPRAMTRKDGTLYQLDYKLTGELECEIVEIRRFSNSQYEPQTDQWQYADIRQPLFFVNVIGVADKQRHVLAVKNPRHFYDYMR